jgi:hypothetical protein
MEEYEMSGHTWVVWEIIKSLVKKNWSEETT